MAVTTVGMFVNHLSGLFRVYVCVDVCVCLFVYMRVCQVNNENGPMYSKFNFACTEQSLRHPSAASLCLHFDGPFYGV